MLTTIYQDENWGKIQEEKEGGTAFTFTYRSADGCLLYPFIKRFSGTVSGKAYFDAVTARGECGIRLTEGELTDDLIQGFDRSFHEYCNKHDIVAEYVRFDPWNQISHRFSLVYRILPHGNVYCIDCSDPDFFYSQISYKRRNQIRRAEKSGLTIELDDTGKLIDEFVSLYQNTVDKYHLTGYYDFDRAFLLRHFDQLKGRISMISARKDGSSVSSAVLANGGDVMHFLYSANDLTSPLDNASSLVIFEACKAAARAGCRYLDMGGCIPGSGLEHFKRSFTSAQGVLPCFIGTKIRNNSIYEALVAANGRADAGRFPEFRRPQR